MKTLLGGLFVAGLMLAGMDAFAAPVQCPVQGKVIQWAADFCMYKAETDDFAHPDVVSCMNKQPEVRKNKACEAKRKYKTEICTMVVQNRSYPGNMEKCLKDKSFAGPTVRNGGLS